MEVLITMMHKLSKEYLFLVPIAVSVSYQYTISIALNTDNVEIGALQWTTTTTIAIEVHVVGKLRMIRPGVAQLLMLKLKPVRIVGSERSKGL